MKWIYGINFGAIHEKMLSESREREKLSIGKKSRSKVSKKVQM